MVMTLQMLRTRCALVVCVLTACTLDLASVSEPPSLAALDAGESVADAASEDGEVADSQVPIVKHASCAMPLPDPMPSEPRITTDAAGRPLFDYWRDFSCDDPDVAGYPTCAGYAGEPIACELCTRASGLCTGSGGAYAAPGDAPLVARSDGCVMGVPLEAKRKACCDGSDQFCVGWPFDGTAKPGQPCAVHADCEPGLTCVSPQTLIEGDRGPFGYGLCVCPFTRIAPEDCVTTRLP
jgi:hypothetical protein